MIRFVAPLLFILPGALICCAPLTAEELTQLQPTLSFTADDGNNLIFATNSNVPLHVHIGRPQGSRALKGNIIISTGRGSDTVTPKEVPIPGSGDAAVLLHVGGPGTASVSASLASLSSSFVIEVAAPDASRSSLIFEPNTVIAGEQAALATLWAKDDQGRNLTGVEATVSADEDSVSFLPKTLRTRVAGKDVCSILATRARPHTFTIDGGGLTFRPTLTVLPAGIDLGNSTVVITPDAPRADGNTQATVTVTVVDAHNNPIEGIAVKIFSSPPYSALVAPLGVTDDTGVFTCGLTSTTPGVASVLVQLFPKSSAHVDLRTSTAFVSPF